MAFDSEVAERVLACMAKRTKLTLGEIGLLEAIEGKNEVTLLPLEAQELKKIEKKLGLA